MKTLINYVKNLVLTNDEKYQLAFAKAYLLSDQYLSPQFGGDIQQVPVLGFDLDERYGLNRELVFRVGEFDFGWVQNILIEPNRDRAVVGHIAVKKNLAGLGLGKRLAKALGIFVKQQHHVNHILFMEQNSNATYDNFFQNTLHATPETYGANSGWLWKIPRE